MTLDFAEIWELHLPLRRAVNWTAGGVEDTVSYVVLILHDRNEQKGAAEITCRPAWNGMTSGLLAQAIRDLAWPRLNGLGPDGSAANALSGIREMTALKAICDNAWRDLTAPSPSKNPVQVASVLTRAAPDDMAQTALEIFESSGTTAFKVKLGQGLRRDADVLAALRLALPDAELSGDANSAYSPEEAIELGAIATEMGLTFLEDPCPLGMGAATRSLAASINVPVMADKAVIGPEVVDAFADCGVTQVSAKPSRIGTTAALAVAQAAGRRGGRICNGTYSESALGAAAQIAFASSLPEGLAHPHEIDFHLGLAAQIAPQPAIRQGQVWPEPGGIADRIDRAALQRFGTRWPLLRNETKELAQ